MQWRYNVFVQYKISTRAPTGGATGELPPERGDGDHFYSRPHGRGDTYTAVPASSWRKISTRAPTGGATHLRRTKKAPGPHFYSRPHGRGDSEWEQDTPFTFLFLLAPPREGRRFLVNLLEWDNLFLLAPPREGRRLDNVYGGYILEFLLAPPREGRQKKKKHHNLQ